MLSSRIINILQRNSFIQSISTHSRLLFEGPNFLISMTGLQLAWLAAIGLTGADTNWNKLLLLMVYTLITGVVVTLLPESVFSKFSNLKESLLKNEKQILLVLSLVTLMIGVFYADHQRTWTNEKYFTAAAKIIAAEGIKGVATSYAEMSVLRYQHPPLISLIYGLAYYLLGDHLFILRLVSVTFLVATVITTYLLGRELYDRTAGLIAALLFLTFPLVFRLGSSALIDIELAFFFSLSVYLCLRLLRKRSYGLAVFLGFVIGLGLLTKYIMIFFYGVLLSYTAISPSFRRLKNYLLTAVLVSGCVFSIWVLYAYQTGILSDQIDRITTVSSIFHLVKEPQGEESPAIADPQTAEPVPSTLSVRTRVLQLGLESIFTRLPSSLGVYNVPLILLGGVYLIRRRTLSDWFILLWIGTVSFFLIITLPGHRYFLSIFPAIAIMMSRLFHCYPRLAARAVLLSLLFSAASLYLFVDWARETNLFISTIP